jgi:transposase InsO family protein
MRTRPDKLSADVTYLWILNCIDHYSKFSWAFPLKNKSANEVAIKLRELFFTFGPPRILHSDNGREFISSVIMELKSLFPELVFIRGRPRHPQSQGCIERANGVLCDALGKWMSSNNSSSWSSALLPVVYGINTRISTVTKKTPYEVMFGQAPRSDSDFWKIVRENGIEDEEHLPTQVDDLEDDLINNQIVDPINFDNGIDNDVITLLNQLSDDAASLLINSACT